MKSKLQLGIYLTLIVLNVSLFIGVFNCNSEKNILETEKKYFLLNNRFIQNEFELKKRILGKKLLFNSLVENIQNPPHLYSIFLVKGSNANEFSYAKTLEFYNDRKGAGKFKNSTLCAVININEKLNYYNSGKPKYENINLVIDSNSTIAKQLNLSLNDFSVIILDDNNICTYLYIVSEAENHLENFLNESIVENILALK